jgi:hypothetical protein
MVMFVEEDTRQVAGQAVLDLPDSYADSWPPGHAETPVDMSYMVQELRGLLMFVTRIDG